jgi:hypothetical protein
MPVAARQRRSHRTRHIAGFCFKSWQQIGAIVMKRINGFCLAISAFAMSAASASAEPPALPDAMQRVMAVAGAAGLAGEIALADQDDAVVDRTVGLADREEKHPHRLGARWL